MKFSILNKNFELAYELDRYQSVIWTERYTDAGDFEIYTDVTSELIQIFIPDYYVYFDESSYLMVIETVQIKSDLEEGNKLVITGRSLESLLGRRIVWDAYNAINKPIYSIIQDLFNANIVNPTDTDRKINNVIFEESVDPEVITPTMDIGLYGESLFEAIQMMCSIKQIGFKITWTDNTFIFRLFKGKDLTIGDALTPRVSFTPNLDNVMSTNYLSSKLEYATICLTVGMYDSVTEKKTTSTIDGGGRTGIERRELYVDGSGVNSYINGAYIPQGDYMNQLKTKADAALKNSKINTSFEGSVDTVKMYKYGEDFNVGDIVHVQNEYGISDKCRIVEMVTSIDLNGYTTYPTLMSLNEEEDI